MRKLIAVLAAALACAIAPAGSITTAHAQAAYSSQAQQVINQARAATGGGAWNVIRGMYEIGQQGGVRYERWADPIRYGWRVETHEAAGKRTRAFNGAAEWEILPDGGVTGSDHALVISKARGESFFATWGLFFPSRYDIRTAYIGVRQHEGRTFDVIAVRAATAAPRELWFDRKTRHLGRMIDRNGVKQTVTEISDYRKVGPVTVPFKHVVDGVERIAESIDFRVADRDLFSLPYVPPPVAAKPPAPPAPAIKAPVKKKR